MKNLLTILLVTFAFQSFAQDTTALKRVGTTLSGELTFFDDDETQLTATTLASSPGNGFAIFMNPNDSLLYAIMGMGPDRNLYSVNPFNGVTTLVADLGFNYYSSADISETGDHFYGMLGNGEGLIGTLVQIEWGSWTESIIGAVPADAGASSFGIEYHPADSAIYCFEGNWGPSYNLKVFRLATTAISTNPLIGFTSGELHGAMWTGVDSVFKIATGIPGDFYDTDALSYNFTLYYSGPPTVTQDMEEFLSLRREADTIGMCPGDSTMISLLYESPAFEWYKDGVLMAETEDTIWVTEAGEYQVLYDLDGTNFMWSETIVVNLFTVPNVNITQAENDTMLCGVGDFITLQGASGGTLQWYLDGTAIPGATSNTYDATAPGSYNQMKTNMSGCSDTSTVAYVIIMDPDCGVGVSENEMGINVYPNPVEDKLIVESKSSIEFMMIHDVNGKVVYTNENLNGLKETIDFSSMEKGSYLITIQTKEGKITSTVIK